MLFSLQGCSFVVNLAFFNNTDFPLEICNLHKTKPNCYSVDSKVLITIPLIANVQSDTWKYSINNKVYSFLLGEYPKYSSDVYCTGFFWKRCDIAVQFQPNELLYWAGKSMALPVKSFALQPNGFPVKPNT